METLNDNLWKRKEKDCKLWEKKKVMCEWRRWDRTLSKGVKYVMEFLLTFPFFANLFFSLFFYIFARNPSHVHQNAISSPGLLLISFLVLLYSFILNNNLPLVRHFFLFFLTSLYFFFLLKEKNSTFLWIMKWWNFFNWWMRWTSTLILCMTSDIAQLIPFNNSYLISLTMKLV